MNEKLSDFSIVLALDIILLFSQEALGFGQSWFGTIPPLYWRHWNLECILCLRGHMYLYRHMSTFTTVRMGTRISSCIRPKMDHQNWWGSSDIIYLYVFVCDGIQFGALACYDANRYSTRTLDGVEMNTLGLIACVGALHVWLFIGGGEACMDGYLGYHI